MTLMEVRNVVLSYYTDKGFRKFPVGIVERRNLSEKTQDFLRDFATFLLTSDFTPDEAKVYLTHEYWTFKHIFAYPRFKDLPESTIRYRLTKAIEEINKYFGKRMLLELLDYKTDCDIYRKVLEELKEKHSAQQHFRSQFAIKLPVVEKGEAVDMARVEALINTIKPYKKTILDNIEHNIDLEALAYIYTLLDNMSTSGQLKEDRRTLKELLRG